MGITEVLGYVNSSLEVGVIAALYYGWRKYLKPYHEAQNKKIEQLYKDKESAIKDKYEMMVKLTKTEVENTHLQEKVSSQ